MAADRSNKTPRTAPDVGTRLIGRARDAVARLTDHEQPSEIAPLPPAPGASFDEDDEISGLADIIDPHRGPELANEQLAEAARASGAAATTLEDRIAVLEGELRALRAPRPFLRRLRDLFTF